MPKTNNVTCDFDLVDENIAILAQLPEACQEAAQDPVLWEAMRIESIKFKQFMTDLENKEIENGYEVDEEDETSRIPKKDWELRSKIYTDAELHMCREESEDENAFIECLSRKRDLMTAAIISN